MSSPRPMAPSSGTPATSVDEADAARAVDAARHDGLDQRADIFVLDRALVLLIAAGVDAVGHRLVLQVAFAALVADRAVERMVDQQELHHAFARLPHHRRAGVDHLRACRRGSAAGPSHPWRRTPAASACPRPRSGTCGNCRRSTAAHGSRSAGFRRPRLRRPGAACTPAGTSISCAVDDELGHGLGERPTTIMLHSHRPSASRARRRHCEACHERPRRRGTGFVSTELSIPMSP